MTPIDGAGGSVEVILTQLPDGEVRAYRNHCQHWTDVRLDRGDGAVVRGTEIVCAKHAATFERATGLCTGGPCEGARLDRVAVEERQGAVHLVEDGYEFDSLGPADGGDDDLDSGGRIGFGGT